MELLRPAEIGHAVAMFDRHIGPSRLIPGLLEMGIVQVDVAHTTLELWQGLGLANIVRRVLPQ